MELTESNIRTVLKSGYTAVALALVSGEEVVLPGLGKLFVEQRAEKAGRNPRTGEVITIPAQCVVKFKPFKALKDAINQAVAE